MQIIDESKNCDEYGRVKLKSILGIHPIICYFLQILFVILLISIVPSIFVSTRRLYILTNIHPLYVEVDGKPAGITPCNLRLKSGRHSLDFFYGDKKVLTDNIKIRHAWFLSYFFEYSQKYYAKVSIDDNLRYNINKNFLQDSIDYQTLFKTDSTYIQKPYFSYYKSLLQDDVSAENINSAKYNIANDELLKDYEKNFGKLNLDVSFVKFDNKLRIKEENLERLELNKEAVIGEREFLIFNKFAVSKDEVDINLFNVFLQENKEFSIENKDKLISDGLVNDDYLLNLDNNGGSIRNVSYNIVMKFLDWFSRRYSCNARLLTKSEYTQLYDYRSRLKNYNSRLYEFTSTDFLTFEALTGKRLELDKRNKIIEQYEKYDVKTNKELFCLSSFNDNADGLKNLDLVGVASRDECFETVGFRICIDYI